MPILYFIADGHLWPSYLLSDVFYSTFIFILIYFYIENKFKLNYKLLLLLFSIILMRPSAVVLPIIIFFNFITSKYIIEFNQKMRLIILTSMCIILSIFIFIFIIKLVDSQYIYNNTVLYIHHMISSGEVVYDRPETWVVPPNSISDYVLIFFKRVYYFFPLWVNGFSLEHNLANLFTVAIFITGIILVYFNFGKSDKDICQIIYLFLIIIFVVTFFHASTVIDYDWRYRYPILPYLCIISSYAFDRLIKKIKNNYFTWKV